MLHGDGDVEGNFSGAADDLVIGREASLDLEQVLTGFEEEAIRAPVQQTLHLLLQAIAQRIETDLAEGRQFGAGADGSEHKAGLAWLGELVGCLPGHACGGAADFEGACGEIVLAECDGG